MKTRIESQIEEDANASRAIRLLCEMPPPDEAMESRLVQRLRLQQAYSQQEQAGDVPASRFSRRHILWPLAAGLALAIVVVLPHERPAPAHEYAALPSLRFDSPSAEAPGVATRPVVAITSHAAPRAYRWPVVHPASARPAETQLAAAAVAQIPPPLPLTQQEQLLIALARSPSALPALKSIARSETVDNHGLGQNAILELNHGPLPQLTPATLGDFE